MKHTVPLEGRVDVPVNLRPHFGIPFECNRQRIIPHPISTTFEEKYLPHDGGGGVQVAGYAAEYLADAERTECDGGSVVDGPHETSFEHVIDVHVDV